RPRRQLVKTVPKEHTVVTTAFQERELVGDNVHIYQIDPYHEEDQLEAVLTHIAPYVKSVSLLPHSDKGIFPQMPQEGISGHEYRVLLDKIKTIDWSVFEGSDGSDELYCTGDSCAV